MDYQPNQFRPENQEQTNPPQNIIQEPQVPTEQVSPEVVPIKKGMKKVWIIVIAVILAGGIAGGGTYMYFNNKATKDKSDLQAKIDEANNTISTLNAKIVNSNANTNSSVVANSNVNSNASISINKDIESVDFSKTITVNTKLDDQLLTPQYVDLNNDNSEEALVVYKYGGTGGTIDFMIYGMKDGSATQLFKKSSLYGGTATIKSGAIYADYVDTNSAENKSKPESDLTVDTHKKFTWNGTIFAESNQ